MRADLLELLSYKLGHAAWGKVGVHQVFVRFLDSDGKALVVAPLVGSLNVIARDDHKELDRCTMIQLKLMRDDGVKVDMPQDPEMPDPVDEFIDVTRATCPRCGSEPGDGTECILCAAARRMATYLGRDK